MSEYIYGSFGVMDMDEMEAQPFRLLDGGLEKRLQKLDTSISYTGSGEDYEVSGKYNFQNDKREGYEGYLFQYALGGMGILERGGQTYPIEKGKGFLISFPENSKYYLSEDREWEFVYLHFDGSGARPFVEKLMKIGKNSFEINENSRPVRMLLRLQEKYMAGGRVEKYEGGMFLHEFLCALLLELECPEDSRNDMVQEAIQIMEKEYAFLEGIENLARQLEVSFAHFSRSFREETGKSPVQYLTNLRLQGAVSDLLNTEENLEWVAKKNGFSNGNYLCKVFKKVMGMTPTQYRQSRKG